MWDKAVLISHQTVWTPHSFACSLPAAMGAIEFKINDLAKVTGFSRFQLDGLLKQVFGTAPLGKICGSQRKFSRQDLVVVVVACEIERKFRVERRALAQVAELLRQVLTGPRGANRGARLLLTLLPPVVTYLEHDTAAVEEGLVVRLGPLFARVDEYLGVAGPSPDTAQAVLPLRPAIAAGRRRASRNR